MRGKVFIFKRLNVDSSKFFLNELQVNNLNNDNLKKDLHTCCSIIELTWILPSSFLPVMVSKSFWSDLRDFFLVPLTSPFKLASVTKLTGLCGWSWVVNSQNQLCFFVFFEISRWNTRAPNQSWLTKSGKFKINWSQHQ